MVASVDMEKFRGYLRTKLQNTSLREASKEMTEPPFHEMVSLSASSISRIANGERIPDLHAFFLICDWMGVHYSEFITDPQQDTQYMPTPDLIESILRSDANIPEQAATSIAQLVKIAYNLTKFESDSSVTK